MWHQHSVERSEQTDHVVAQAPKADRNFKALPKKRTDHLVKSG
jgi:hypothetical protein